MSDLPRGPAPTRAFAKVIEEAAGVAAAHAEDVDVAARFPQEALAVLREGGALAATVPTEFGGPGLTLREAAHGCAALARGCSSTAMVFAMHLIQIATLSRHAEPASHLGDYLTGLVQAPRLIASVTSEVGTSGDMGRSVAGLEASPAGGFTLFKRAPTISYGAQAEDLLITVRRGAHAAPEDQVVVLVDSARAEVVETSPWDTLGMRGTCSSGFTVRADVAPSCVLDTPFAEVMPRSMVPVSHVLWGHVWLGIASGAFERGKDYARSLAKGRPGERIAQAEALARVMADLTLLESEAEAGLRLFEDLDAAGDREAFTRLSSVLRFNNLKRSTSEQAPLVCQGVLNAIGIAGYRNDSPYAVGRHLRDSLAGRLMVANDRIVATDASLVLASRRP